MAELDVTVVGSLNMDLVARAPRLPVPGETLIGRSFSSAHGGKGANQAVAAARLGARTAMIGCVGDDPFGAELRSGLEADGIDCRAVATVAGASSGVALIVVDERGNNGIVVVPGANGTLAPEVVTRHGPVIAAARIVALQLEVPLETVARAASVARVAGKTVVLNPAPAQLLPAGLLACVDFLVPNELEAAALAGIPVDSVEDAFRAGERLRAAGAANVLVTLGERGVAVVTAAGARHLPAPRVEAVDTTAAGDTFIGGLCAALARGRSVPEAVEFAQAAAAISVTRSGAQPSIPFEREVVTRGAP